MDKLIADCGSRIAELPLLMALLLALIAPSQAQRNQPKAFQDVRKGHWAYAEAASLRKAGLKMAYIPFERDPRVVTRYEFAVCIDRCLQEVGLVSYGKPGSATGAHPLTRSIAVSLARLVKEFRDELRDLGVNVPKVSERLRAAIGPPDPPGSQPFPDVPPDHWSFHAVESLRQKGILRGYPDGTFNRP